MSLPPQRNLTDPKALRAFASPVRLRILECLYVDGPLTATELSEPVGESPANCSWHLRELARYGFVEETGGGKGRQRPWRAVVEGLTWDRPGDQGELALAGEATTQFLSHHATNALSEWLQWRRNDPPEWQDAAFDVQTITWMTSQELREIANIVTEQFAKYAERSENPDLRPPGARPIRFVAWGIPARRFKESTAGDDDPATPS